MHLYALISEELDDNWCIHEYTTSYNVIGGKPAANRALFQSRVTLFLSDHKKSNWISRLGIRPWNSCSQRRHRFTKPHRRNTSHNSNTFKKYPNPEIQPSMPNLSHKRPYLGIKPGNQLRTQLPQILTDLVVNLINRLVKSAKNKVTKFD